MIKSSLAIKGARFEASPEMLLSGRGASGESKMHRSMLFEERGGAESYTIRSSSPSPSVASLISSAQQEMNKHQQQVVVDADRALSFRHQQNYTQNQNVQNNYFMGGNAATASAMKPNPANLSLVNSNATANLCHTAGQNAVAEEMRRQTRIQNGGNGPVPSDDASIASGSTRSMSLSAQQGQTRPGNPTSDNAKHTTNGIQKQQIARYWAAPIDQQNGDDVVVIHVCDENRQISKDFCCKRNILVAHMKYFEKFLKENEAGYDDIDISVHCDVEIFEWLMTYIHEPEKPPVLEKAIVVSILISSDFLQMDALVEHCLVHISNTLNETIRLPIDLSCISDKIVNRLAALTSPKTLAHTKDRKDKILNKLYKRRVELDFSRKSGARGGVRTIAASLTCCRYCGIVYLDNCVSFLHCNDSPLAIDYRGKLTKRHNAIPAWSLTTYLKNLHVSGMNWDCIYWHVWASCQVYKVSDFMVSAIEIDRYTVEPDGLYFSAPNISSTGSLGVELGVTQTSTLTNSVAESTKTESPSNDKDGMLPFSLGAGDALSGTKPTYKLTVSAFEQKSNSNITYSLNPSRPPEILPMQNYELIVSQAKFISSPTNKALIQKQAAQMLQTSTVANDFKPFDFQRALFCDLDAGLSLGGFEEHNRGRSRSPTDKGRKGKLAEKGGALITSKSQTRGLGVPEKATNKERKDKKDVADATDSNDPGSSVERDKRDASHDANSGTDDEKKGGGRDADTRRSRSMGAPNIQNSATLNFKGKSDARKGSASGTGEKPSAGAMRRVVNNPGENAYRAMTISSPSVARQITMFKTVPPEVIRRVHMSKGSVKGVWLQPHPLQLHPVAYADSLNIAKDAVSTSEQKKFEWQMDLLREYDERKNSKIESFLVGNRNIMESNARSANVIHAVNALKFNTTQTSATKLNGKDVYYRDKARQPLY